MQAQFHPTERPSSPSPRSTSSRQAGVQEPLLPLSRLGTAQAGTAQAGTTQSGTGQVTVEQQQAARNGDFRAIASILNAILAPYEISAWVGEAGPGYLQITLTVKRPPKRQPLIRLISHQLYSLHSDVILGANLTVQVAQTNLILWHQLVRLPLPEIYKQPSQWQVWRDQLTTSAQSGWTHGRQRVMAWYQTAKTHPLWTPAPDSDKEETETECNSAKVTHQFLSPETHPPQSPLSKGGSSDPLPMSFGQASQIQGGVRGGSSTVGRDADNESGGGTEPTPQQPPTSIPPDILLQAQQYAQQQTEKQAKPPEMKAKPVEAGIGTAMAMVPGVVVPPFPVDSSVSAQMLPSFLNNVLNSTALNSKTDAVVTLEAAPEPALEPTPEPAPGFALGTAPEAAPELAVEAAELKAASSLDALSDGWQQSWKRMQTAVIDQVARPSPWLISGAAIAAFLLGSLVIESLIESKPENEASRSGTLSNTSNGAPVITSDVDPAEQLQVDAVTETRDPLAPSEQSSSQPSTHNSQAHSDPIQRPKTVSFNGQEIEVISLVPTTSSRSEVTLTFSNDAVVPLPPPEPESKGWQWPFSAKPVAPIRHPADMAIAIFDTPLQRSSRDGSDEQVSSAHPSASTPALTPQILRQGGIDVVNIAGHTIARTKAPSLPETLQLLEQASIYSVGAGLDHETASRPQVFDVKGHRIAILGYVDTYLYSADQNMAGNNPGTPRPLTMDIEAIRDQVDWVIVTYHWHDILDTTPTQQQVKLAHLAVDQGADLVVGYHPGVMQGSEIYNGRAIAYSLGPLPTEPSLAAPPHHGTGVEATSADASRAGTASLGSPSPLPLTAMLKVVLGDDRMGIEFVPVQPGLESSAYVGEADTQTVLRAVRSASESFDVPLPANGAAHLSLEETIRGFSNSAGDTFQPNSDEPFIGNDDPE